MVVEDISVTIVKRIAFVFKISFSRKKRFGEYVYYRNIVRYYHLKVILSKAYFICFSTIKQ